MGGRQPEVVERRQHGSGLFDRYQSVLNGVKKGGKDMVQGMTRAALLLILVFAVAGAVGAEEITKVGVVDLTKVFNVYASRDAGGGRKLLDFWTETNDQLGKITKEISDLEVLKEKAKKENDNRAVLDYDKQISEKKEYQRDYYRYRKLEYDKEYDALMKSSSFYNDMLKAIEFIAVRESFSLILKTTDPSLVYYAKNVDITQDVIDLIKK
jgi:outer membrane protein